MCQDDIKQERAEDAPLWNSTMHKVVGTVTICCAYEQRPVREEGLQPVKPAQDAPSPSGHTPFQQSGKTLLASEELGDRRPTQLLRPLQQLLGEKASTIDETLLREPFLQRLPASVRMILASAKSTTLPDIANMADNIMDVGSPVIAAVGPQHEPPAIMELRKDIIDLKDTLAAQDSHVIDDLRAEMNNLVKMVQSLGPMQRGRSRSASRRPAPARRQSPTPSNNVSTTVLESGKRDGQQLTAVSEAGHPPTRHRLFYVTDRATKQQFLVDTGAPVSIIPASITDRRGKPAAPELYAVNGSAIHTYGERSLTLDIGLRRTFRWIFVVADIAYAIIGVDFLRYFGLLVDIRQNRLLD
ncbi:uncharacterized protein LOC135385882 [Ornithodoros turicata]|uniref:uncharacterized protein LOC135385882 n=1 Tax=Ornithodoros turicata TaxID=34597 RepID=UPI003138C9EB